MIKLIDILENKILVPRRGKEERAKNHKIALQKQIQQYIKDGSKGDLSLGNTPITFLPNNLTKVGGDLWLSFSKITSLPDNLEVEGILDLTGIQITSLPNNLQVGGDLDLIDTPLSKKYSVEEINQMVEDKGGKVEGGIYF
tara:strand:- start:148 stop:570 length:423 start_codon:yes stop_codon:yes gene_type:complete